MKFLTIPKKPTTSLTIALSCALALPIFAQEATPTEEAPADEAQTEENAQAPSNNEAATKAKAMIEALNDREKREFGEAMIEGTKFLREKRVQEALDKLTDAELILPDHPDVLNMKGSIFVNIRDFDRAAEYFDRVDKLYPGMWQTDFNSVEMDFVRDDWAKALEGFHGILNDYSDSVDADTLRLIDFKIAICQLKLEKPAEAKKIIEKYGYYDATPIFYYGNAAIAFQAGDDIGASEWIRSAKEIYPAQLNFLFEDSLFEAGWLLML